MAFRFNAATLNRRIAAAEATARQQAALSASLAVKAAEASVVVDYQPLDSDLTDIAALSPSNDDFLQLKSGEWTNRAPAQAKADLSLAKGDVGLGDVDNTADADKPVSTDTQTALDGKLDAWVSVPSSASDTGTAGQIAYDGTNLYVCVATDTWVKTTLATF